MCHEERACQKKKWKNVSRGQKRAFCSFFHWELSPSFLVFSETNVVLFTNYQRYLNGQSMRKNFFQCEMPWTALTEIATLEVGRNTRRSCKAASCVLCNRTEHSQGFSICYKECSGMLRNLPECSIGLVLSMVLKPNALFSLLYYLLRLLIL